MHALAGSGPGAAVWRGGAAETHIVGTGLGDGSENGLHTRDEDANETYVGRNATQLAKAQSYVRREKVVWGGEMVGKA